MKRIKRNVQTYCSQRVNSYLTHSNNLPRNDYNHKYRIYVFLQAWYISLRGWMPGKKIFKQSFKRNVSKTNAINITMCCLVIRKQNLDKTDFSCYFKLQAWYCNSLWSNYILHKERYSLQTIVFFCTEYFRVFWPAKAWIKAKYFSIVCFLICIESNNQNGINEQGTR